MKKIMTYLAPILVPPLLLACSGKYVNKQSSLPEPDSSSFEAHYYLEEDLTGDGIRDRVYFNPREFTYYFREGSYTQVNEPLKFQEALPRDKSFFVNRTAFSNGLKLSNKKVNCLITIEEYIRRLYIYSPHTKNLEKQHEACIVKSDFNDDSFDDLVYADSTGLYYSEGKLNGNFLEPKFIAPLFTFGLEDKLPPRIYAYKDKKEDGKLISGVGIEGLGSIYFIDFKFDKKDISFSTSSSMKLKTFRELIQ